MIRNKGVKGLPRKKRNTEAIKRIMENIEGRQINGIMMMMKMIITTILINSMKKSIMQKDTIMMKQERIGMKNEQRESFQNERMIRNL